MTAAVSIRSLGWWWVVGAAHSLLLLLGVGYAFMHLDPAVQIYQTAQYGIVGRPVELERGEAAVQSFKDPGGTVRIDVLTGGGNDGARFRLRIRDSNGKYVREAQVQSAPTEAPHFDVFVFDALPDEGGDFDVVVDARREKAVVHGTVCECFDDGNGHVEGADGVERPLPHTMKDLSISTYVLKGHEDRAHLLWERLSQYRPTSLRWLAAGAAALMLVPFAGLMSLMLATLTRDASPRDAALVSSASLVVSGVLLALMVV